MSEGNGGRTGGRWLKPKCSVCGKTELASGPTTFLGEPINPDSPRTAVRPFFCGHCGAVTLYASTEQPENPFNH